MCSPVPVWEPSYVIVIVFPDMLASVIVKSLSGSTIVSLDAICSSVFHDGIPAGDMAGADGAVAGTGLMMDEPAKLADV